MPNCTFKVVERFKDGAGVVEVCSAIFRFRHSTEEFLRVIVDPLIERRVNVDLMRFTLPVAIDRKEWASMLNEKGERRAIFDAFQLTEIALHRAYKRGMKKR